MLYDEEGNVYTEPPLLPEDEHIYRIVKDYRRMFNEYHNLRDGKEKLKEENSKLKAKYQKLALHSRHQRDTINHCIRLLKKNNVPLTTYLENYMKCYNIKNFPE